MIVWLGSKGALSDALADRVEGLRVLIDADIDMGLRRLGDTPSVLIASAGASDGARWRAALGQASRAEIPLVVLSSIGTVAGSYPADVAVSEDAPYHNGHGQPRLEQLIRHEQQVRRNAERRGTPHTVLRIPLLIGPGTRSHQLTSRLLHMIRHPAARWLEGGLNLADVRDVADLLAQVVHRPGVWPAVHAPGTALTTTQLQRRLQDVGLARLPLTSEPKVALELLRAAAAGRHRARGLAGLLTRHWGASSLVVGRHLPWQPRSLQQSLSEWEAT